MLEAAVPGKEAELEALEEKIKNVLKPARSSATTRAESLKGRAAKLAKLELSFQKTVVGLVFETFSKAGDSNPKLMDRRIVRLQELLRDIQGELRKITNKATESMDALKLVLSNEITGIHAQSETDSEAAAAHEEAAHEEAAQLRRQAKDAAKAEERQQDRRTEAESKLKEALDGLRRSRNDLELTSGEVAYDGPTGGGTFEERVSDMMAEAEAAGVTGPTGMEESTSKAERERRRSSPTA